MHKAQHMKPSKAKKLATKIAVATAAAFLVSPLAIEPIASVTHARPIPVAEIKAHAEERSYGIDMSRYQGYTAAKVYPHDEFGIAQIGGTNGGQIYDQAPYTSQIKTGIANGLRMHTYLWDQSGNSIYWTDQMLNYFLPRIQTPKGSIVALDYEAGASSNIEANTDNIIHGMQRIKDAGYTPMYYSYKPYTLAHVDWNRVNAAFPNSGWIAAYPDYNVRSEPYWGVFPSMPGVSIYQFTSTYRAGGLDGNISLAPGGHDITWNGYRQGDAQKPITNTPAVQQGKQLHQDTHTYTVRSGDSWWSIANSHGMSMYALAQLNGKTISSTIYPGQVLRVADSGDGNKVTSTVNKPVAQPQSSSWTDSLGDTWHSEHGTFTSNTYLHLRWGARTTSTAITTIGPGTQIKYDAWSRHGGWVWLRQPRNGGGYAYLVCRNAYGTPFGTFK